MVFVTVAAREMCTTMVNIQRKDVHPVTDRATQSSNFMKNAKKIKLYKQIFCFSKKSCITCQRTGRVTCHHCKRSGRLKWFLQLTVDFKNNTDDYIKKSEAIPDQELRECLAMNVFSENNNRVKLFFSYFHLCCNNTNKNQFS